MTELIAIIYAHLEYAPFIIFGVLLLAGFNIPISEDAMVFVSALLASHNPEYAEMLFAGVYLGAYCSDLICYCLGRIVGPKLLRFRLFARIMQQERIEKIQAYYQRYGIITLIFGRFIPFGVRNSLFLTAGLGKMNVLRFAFSDLFACTLSTVTFFTLYYHYGKAIVGVVKQANLILFILALTIALYFYLRKK
ncbi:MAG: DedA family protein [Gammaproteobacteria bacterium]